MGINLSKVKGGSTNKNREPDVDEGTYPARFVQIIDLGVQPQRPYKGEDKPPAPEVMLTYEFLDEFLHDEDGNEDITKPRFYSESITVHNLKADLAKSTKRYKVLDPDLKYGGDFTAVLGAPVMVTLVHRPNKNDAERPYVNVHSITPMSPKQAARAPELVNKTKVFDLDNPDLDVFESLSDWVRDKIKNNLHYPGSKLAKLLSSASDTKEPPVDDSEIPW